MVSLKLIFRTRWFVVVTVAWASSLCARAQDDTPWLRAEVTYDSRQVVRGIERSGAAARVAAEFTIERWFARVGGTQPFSNGEESQGAIAAGYRWPQVAGVQLESVLKQTWFAHSLGGALRQSTEAELLATLPTLRGFTPSVSYVRDLRRRADIVELRVARSVALTRWGTFLDWTLFSGWAAGEEWRPDAGGAQARDSYHYWGAEVYVPYRIGAHTTLLGGLHHTSESGRSLIHGPVGRRKGSNGWVTLGVSFDF